MFKSHFGETVTVVLAIVMVIIFVSVIIPYKDWSVKFTALFHALILNTCNTVIVSAANASGIVKTPMGNIRVSCKIENGAFKIDYEVPQNIEVVR